MSDVFKKVIKNINDTIVFNTGYTYCEKGLRVEIDSDSVEYLKPENLKKGNTVLGVNGELIKYAEEDKGGVAYSVSKTQQQVIESVNSDPYENKAVVNFTVNKVSPQDIDENLLQKNIKNGISIFGVTGTAGKVYEQKPLINVATANSTVVLNVSDITSDTTYDAFKGIMLPGVYLRRTGDNSGNRTEIGSGTIKDGVSIGASYLGKPITGNFTSNFRYSVSSGTGNIPGRLTIALLNSNGTDRIVYTLLNKYNI